MAFEIKSVESLEPGWKWSDHLKPIAGTESCEANHLLYCLGACTLR